MEVHHHPQAMKEILKNIFPNKKNTIIKMVKG